MKLTIQELNFVNGNVMRIMENRVMSFTGCDKQTANLVANEILDLDRDSEKLLNAKMVSISEEEYEELLWKSEAFDKYERDFGNITT